MLLFISRQFNHQSLLHIPFCASMYRSIACAETLPAVAQKYERVHRLGNLVNIGNSLRRSWAVRPFSIRTISCAGTTLLPLINKCRWSGWTARCSISHSWLRETSRKICSSLIATLPIRIGFRLFGHHIRWYNTRWTRWLSCLYSLFMLLVYHIPTKYAIAEREGGRFLYGLKPIASTPYLVTDS